MLPSFSLHRIALASLLLLAVSGCDRDLDLLAPADFPSDADVFLDGYSAGVSFQAFAGSKTDAVQIDGKQTIRGILSTTQIAKQTGIHVDTSEYAGSFAELQASIG